MDGLLDGHVDGCVGELPAHARGLVGISGMLHSSTPVHHLTPTPWGWRRQKCEHFAHVIHDLCDQKAHVGTRMYGVSGTNEFMLLLYEA